MNAALDLQRALRLCLLSDSRTSALSGGRVFDGVPQGASFPYVAFGDSEVRDWSTQTRRGHEHIVALHIWSAERGRKEALDIIDAIDMAIERGLPAMTAHRPVSVSTIFWTVLEDIANELYHGVMRLRITTQSLGEVQ